MKIVPIVSGGLDSVTMLYSLLHHDDEIAEVVTFDYGQRHVREVRAAAGIVAELRLQHRVLRIDSMFSGSALTGDRDVPEGHYAEPSMRATIVPGRNLVMLAMAASRADALGAGAVAIAVHAGDHFVYPDCRPEFIGHANAAIRSSSEGRVGIVAPFINADKAGIAAHAERLGVPVERTWSCYQGGERHCGACGTCIERREAFALAGVEDPTPYASTPELPVAP